MRSKAPEIEHATLVRNSSKSRSVARIVREDGPWRLAHRGARRSLAAIRNLYLHQLNRRFDRQFHVETGGIVTISELAAGNSRHKRIDSNYQAVDAAVFSLMIDAITPLDLESRVFIDIGAGKGRAVFLAAAYPFKKIIGVELAAELCSVMQQNIRTYRNKKQRCFDIECVCADANDFAIPDDDCVFFIFNTLRRAALEELVGRLEQSLAMRERSLIVLYLNPAPGNNVMEIFANTGRFRQRSLTHPLFRLLSPSDLAIFEATRHG